MPEEFSEFLEGKAKLKAMDNVEKWGVQERETLLLAMLEELGELTQNCLENRYENGLNNEYNELYDLTALMYQYMIVLEQDRFGYEYSKEDFDL